MTFAFPIEGRALMYNVFYSSPRGERGFIGD